MTDAKTPSSGKPPSTGKDSVQPVRNTEPLRECVKDALVSYFATLDGHDCGGLYELVMREVEAPLLEAALEYVGGNQSKAAQMLGINRGTLRKKLRLHGLD